MHTAGRPFNEGKSCRAHGAWASLRNGKNVETSGGTNKFAFCLTLPKNEGRLVPCHLFCSPRELLKQQKTTTWPGKKAGWISSFLRVSPQHAGKLFCQGVFKAETQFRGKN